MIEAIAVNKSFGKLSVLRNVSFSSSQGHCVALIGPNGCGKTTFIKSLLGMVVPDSGIIKVKGELVNKGWSYRSAMGYMPQIGRYPENMKIGQVIEMLVDIRKCADSLDEDIINAYALKNLYHKRLGTLSGGTMQKVSAAIAFMFNPDILVLDEPTAGLDPVAAEILKEKILAEKARGKLFLITSHILSELNDMVSHIVYMQDGQVIFHKPIEELKSETGEDRLQKAIAHFMKKERR